MYTEEDLYWIWLCSQQGVGPAKRSGLIRCCGNLASVYEASREQYEKAGLTPEQAQRLEESKDLENWRRQCEKWEEEGIQVLTRADPRYPKCMNNLYPSVDLLFLRGNAALLDMPCIAVVGARKCSSYGASAARYLGRKLSQAGYTIISGMAYGIDACAHQGTLDARGNTIAVLGSGIDVCYPRENQRLYDRILRQGLVISEYKPGQEPRAGYFPMRNRMIAAMAQAVIVVEAAERSGALITADQALENGTEVFAVPGSMFSPTSKGTHRLIQQGAALVSSWTDIIQNLQPTVPAQSEKDKRFQDADVQSVWEQIGWEAQNEQQIAVRLGMNAARFMQCVTVIELTGYALRTSDGCIVRKK